MNVEPRVFNFTRIVDSMNFRFLDAMDDLVRIRDLNGEILFENKAMRELLHEVILKSYKDDQTRLFFMEAYENLKNKKETFKREVKIDKKLYEVNASPIYDDNGEIDAFIEVFRDITLERNISKELFQTNKKINEDILLAKTIQKSILPTKGEYKNVNFQFAHIPSNNLSGDVFDVIEINDDKIGVYIADVVGHGISASIMTMFIRQSMRSIVEEEHDLTASQTIDKLKEMFKQLDLDVSQYFSILYMVIDFENKKIKYVNAGHNCYPLLFNDKNIGFLYNSGKFISNIFPDAEYEEKVLDLNKGDRILFYTDGLIETTNENGVFFGEDRLVRWVKKNRNEKKFVKKLLNDVELFRWKEQIDDIAIVFIEIRS